jgi:uncharacterized integral membrane protein
MTDDSMTDERMTGSKDKQVTDAADTVSESRYPADMSVWIIWGVIMIMAIAVLPFAVRNQDVVRAIAHMCGFVFG